MEILYTKSFWEMDMTFISDPTQAFLGRVAVDGLDGTEMFLPLIADSPARVLELHQEHGLKHRIIDIITEGETSSDHRESFDRAIATAVAFEPMLINSHTGRDIFPFADNVELYRHAIARSAEVAVPIVHETHRFRPAYSAVATRRYLEELPDLLLNADPSH